MPKRKYKTWADRHDVTPSDTISKVRALPIPSIHVPVARAARQKHSRAQWWFDQALSATSLGGVTVDGVLRRSLEDWTRTSSSFPASKTIALYLKYRLTSTAGLESRYIKASTLRGWASDIITVWTRATERTVSKAVRSEIDDICTALTKTYSLSMSPAKRANISVDLIFEIHDAIWALPSLSAMGRLCMSTYLALAAQTGARIGSMIRTTPSGRDTTFKDFTIYVMANTDARKPCRLFGYWTPPHIKNFKRQVIAIGEGPTCTTSAPLMVLLNYVRAGAATIKDLLDLLRPGSLIPGQPKKVVFKDEW